MSIAMLAPTEFASQLAAWQVRLPNDAAHALATWQAAWSVIDAAPVDDLRARVTSGAVDADTVAEEIIKVGAARSAASEAREIVNDLAYPCYMRFADAITAEADRIVTDLTEPFDRQVAIVTAAAGYISPGTTGEDALNLGAEAVTAWHNMATAARQLDSIAAVRVKLTAEFGYGSVRGIECFIRGPLDDRGRSQAHYIAKGRVDSMYDLPEARGGVWQHLIGHGYTLHLNTAAEAEAVATGRTPDPQPVAA